MGKRLVVFGAGYIGGEVAKQALARGWRVAALTRNRDTAASLEALGAAVEIADLASPDWHPKIPGEADLVLNTVSSGGSGIDGYRRSYLEGMRSILAWARLGGAAGTLVYTSSTSVYPQGGGARVDENSPTDSADERARLLRDAECLLESAVAWPAPACRRYFILRLAGIYGPSRSQLLEQVRAGHVTGSSQHRLNLAHRDDICAAIWSAFDAPASVANEIFNVADDAPTPKGDVATWLAGRIGRPPPAFTETAMPARRRITPDRIIDATKLKRRLGWRPHYPSFREGYEAILSTSE